MRARTKVIGSSLFAAAVALATGPTTQAVITFNNTIVGGNASFSTAVTQAEALWQGTFNDNVTLNLTFNFQADNSFLAFASSQFTVPNYTTYRTALVADQSGATDTQALSTLPVAATVNFTTRKGGVVGLDNNNTNNNTFLAVPRANAKAAGTLAATDPGNDASITVSTTAVPYDFDRSNGIDFTQYDIVGVIAHEIGHTMGFTSFADNLDSVGGGNSSVDANAELRVLDLFRRKANGGGIDVTPAGDPYLSIDNGATRVGNLSSGVSEGDRFQASHWENRGPQDPDFPINAGPVIGVMDPQIANGEMAGITAADIVAFDAIGWTVPEPTSATLLVAGAAGLMFRRRRQSV